MGSPQALDSKELYTVGWIAALPLELAAASAVLDEEHKPPLDFEQPSTDKNSYTWGRIGEHNVVLTSLAAGVYGTNSPATTAMQLLSSIPSIRVGLLVGIGAAIARPEDDKDIRLGDIVVSQPDGTNGGVVQYDLGKAKSGHKFERKGVLNMPPKALLKALAKLQARHERQTSLVPQILEKMLGENPMMAKSRSGKPSYAYQGKENDKLFNSCYEHIGGGKGCRKCDSSQEIPREDRESEDPEIHYGTIASGNMLVKDSATRDDISEDNETCICLEMEAAGLMNSFPCLVIRGICDYADSHKNDQWQRYAAAVAAAYAKEFLGFVDNVDLANTSKAMEMLREISTEIRKLDLHVEDARENLQRLILSQREREVVSWLSAPDPSVNYDKARKECQEGTGLWLLTSDSFSDWKIQPNSFLWLCGIPGCGKTVLSSSVIQELEQHTNDTRLLLYFYFDFGDPTKQSLEDMIRTLIKQAYCQRTTNRQFVDQLWVSCKNGKERATQDSLIILLRSLLSDMGEVFIVLDALDESPLKQPLSVNQPCKREDLLQWLEEIEEDITAALRSWIRPQDRIPLQQTDVDKDIKTYVRYKIRHDKKLTTWQSRPEVQQEIEARLLEKANGMFRWVVCQIDLLRDAPNLHHLRQRLESLPIDLDKTYEHILKGIPREYSREATAMLRLLIWSDRALRFEELAEAIIIYLDKTPSFDIENRYQEPRYLLRICSSLVTLVNTRRHPREHTKEGDLEVRLAHFSVKEYLVSDRVQERFSSQLGPVESRTYLAKICLKYLIDIEHDLRLDETRKQYPFSQYSARYWMDHAVKTGEGNEDESLWHLVSGFFAEQGALSLSIDLYNADAPWVEEPKNARSERLQVNALYYASLNGLVRGVQDLIINGADIKAEGGECGNALQAASDKGHREIVQMLLDNGADVNAQGGYYGNALQAASYKGHDKIVQILLAKGADVNAQGGYYGNAFHATSYAGHDKIMQMLLDKGADVNAQGGEFGNALQAASLTGYDKVVRMLLDNGADVNAQGGWYGDALQAASYGGHEKIVLMLLDNGADVNAQGGRYGNALQAASYRGHDKVVQTLVDRGAAVDTTDSERRTALHLAASGGHVRIFRFLLSQSIDLKQADIKFNDVLDYASAGASLAMVEEVLALELEASSKKRSPWSPLHWACRRGDVRLVKLLLAHGFQDRGVETKEISGQWTPYAIAILHQNRNLVSSDGIPDVSSPLSPSIASDHACLTYAKRHEGYCCDGCEQGIYGPRFHCNDCKDFDYCFMCMSQRNESHAGHRWEKIDPPQIVGSFVPNPWTGE